MLDEEQKKKIESPDFDTEVKRWISNWYRVWAEDNVIKNQSYRHLGRTNLTSFWQNGRDNYDVIVPVKSKGDWKRTAKRTITRDKANGFIGKLVKKLIAPQVIAQNKNQEIDIQASRIFKILLEWWERQCKASRVYLDIVHTAVVDGTVHVFQYIENGKEVREVVPNEEIFIPNFYQADIQKQSHLIRAHITTYDEVKLTWGYKDNFKYVIGGTPDKWNVDDKYFNDLETAITAEDEVLIIYLWVHGGYDEDGKPKPKEYNVLINGVPMFEINHKQNLAHNLYPGSKSVFEKFSLVTFYWGNSLPNKIKHDQAYLDAYRTILLNKGILNLGRPLFNKGQEHLDEDVIVPFKVTPTQLGKDEIFTIEGIGDPVTQADIQLEQVIERQINEGTQPPAALGQEGGRAATLGEIQIKDARASELLEIFGKLTSFIIEDLSEQSLSNIIQFEIKRGIQTLVDNADILYKKVIEIDNQPLESGDMGVLSLNFVAKDQQPSSMDIATEEAKLKRQGVNKEIMHIDPSWLEQLDRLIYVVGNPVDQMSEAAERLFTLETYKEAYFNNPNVDQREATRKVIRVNKDDETKLLAKAQPVEQPPQEPGAPSITPPSTRMKQSVKPKVRI